jgi:hypothetical protein
MIGDLGSERQSMKLKPEGMLLFELDYGDLIRPPFRILRGRVHEPD